MEIVIRFDNKAEVLIEKLIGAIANINGGQAVDKLKEEVPVAPVTEEVPVVPVTSPTYTLAEVQLAASTFARSSETAAGQIKDVLKATFGVGRISEIAEDRLFEFANVLISLGAKL